jgi:UDP:flavonoid glycosyltransferase YjiC (YdhE family)
VVVSLSAPPEERRERIFRAAADALSTLGVRAVLIGPARPRMSLPDNVRVGPAAALPALVRHAAAVVCDGVHGTVCAAFHQATPVVVVPVAGEQPIIARQVVRAVAGVRVPARQQDPARLRRAITTALADPRVRSGARRIRDSFAAAKPTAAADRLELLLTAPTVRR